MGKCNGSGEQAMRTDKLALGQELGQYPGMDSSSRQGRVKPTSAQELSPQKLLAAAVVPGWWHGEHPLGGPTQLW